MKTLLSKPARLRKSESSVSCDGCFDLLSHLNSDGFREVVRVRTPGVIDKLLTSTLDMALRNCINGVSWVPEEVAANVVINHHSACVRSTAEAKRYFNLRGSSRCRTSTLQTPSPPYDPPQVMIY